MSLDLIKSLSVFKAIGLADLLKSLPALLILTMFNIFGSDFTTALPIDAKVLNNDLNTPRIPTPL